MEFGCSTLASCIDILKVLPPLSPPILIHTSSSGINPSCHVNRLQLESKYVNPVLTKLVYPYMYLWFDSSSHVANFKMSGVWAYAAVRISNPPPVLVNVNITSSARMSRGRTVFTSLRCFASLDRRLPQWFIHLYMNDLGLLVIYINVYQPSKVPQFVPGDAEVSFHC